MFHVYEQILEEQDENRVFKGKPIADLYPKATILCKTTRTVIHGMNFSFCIFGCSCFGYDSC
jgi:hypothetical protein